MKRERIARIVAEADLAPVSTEVAKRHGISYRSLMRYQERARSDASLAALVAQEKAALGEDWRRDAIEFIRTAFRRLTELSKEAKVENIRAIAGAVKVTGELLTVREVLGDGKHAGADREGPAPSEAAGDDADRRLPRVH